MTTKTVYQTDRAGHYVCETQADESPLQPGVWLVPAGAIETAPPAEWPENQWPRWNGAAWELVTRPAAVEGNNAVAKLQQFLAANHDVANMLNLGGV